MKTIISYIWKWRQELKSSIEYRDNTRLQRLIKIENHCVPCIVQNIKFQTLNFTRRKITKASQVISLIYSKSISMTYFWTEVVKEPVAGNFASNYPLPAIEPTTLYTHRIQKSAGKLHFYGDVSWRYQVVRTRLTNADNLARWQPRTPFPTAVVRPSSRLPTSNWFGAFNFTKITGTWGRGTQVPLMVIIYGNGTGRSTAQTTREHGSLFSERGMRERGIFAGRCLEHFLIWTANPWTHGDFRLVQYLREKSLCIFLFLVLGFYLFMHFFWLLLLLIFYFSSSEMNRLELKIIRIR